MSWALLTASGGPWWLDWQTGNDLSSESWLLWGGAVAVCGLVLAPYLIRMKRRERLDRERLAEADRLGIRQAVGLFPFVDPQICIGCGGCIKACPEDDVLGLVGGLAVVVNGARCIGIGQCERVCPVGAIEVGLGDVKGRADMPVLDRQGQSTVPGLYLIGELSGLALVHNAVAQGRDAVRHLLPELAEGHRQGVLDLAIVGAGPAGLSAALAAREATQEGRRLSFAVFERELSFGGTIFNYPRNKLTHTQPVDLPLHGALSRGEYSKEELLEIFEGLIERFDLPLRFGETLTGIARDGDDCLVLSTSAGDYRCRRVLLALGRRGTPRKLGVDGEELPKVMYQVRDAGRHRHSKILCVGGGDSAVEAAMGLAKQPGNRVTLSYRKEKFVRIKKKNQDRLGRMIAKGKIVARMSSRVTQIDETTVCLQDPEGEEILENDKVFVLIGGQPPFDWLRNLGIRFGDQL